MLSYLLACTCSASLLVVVAARRANESIDEGLIIAFHCFGGYVMMCDDHHCTILVQVLVLEL
jgi:hypothetical protein